MALKQWIQGKTSMSDEDIEKSFQIPLDLDNIQWFRDIHIKVKKKKLFWLIFLSLSEFVGI